MVYSLLLTLAAVAVRVATAASHINGENPASTFQCPTQATYEQTYTPTRACPTTNTLGYSYVGGISSFGHRGTFFSIYLRCDYASGANTASCSWDYNNVAGTWRTFNANCPASPTTQDPPSPSGGFTTKRNVEGHLWLRSTIDQNYPFACPTDPSTPTAYRLLYGQVNDRILSGPQRPFIYRCGYTPFQYQGLNPNDPEYDCYYDVNGNLQAATQFVNTPQCPTTLCNTVTNTKRDNEDRQVKTSDLRKKLEEGKREGPLRLEDQE